MKIEQTSNFIKVPSRIIQGFTNAVDSAVKINPQEIAILSATSTNSEPTLPDKTSKTNFTHAQKIF
jgi:hypothetical protein